MRKKIFLSTDIFPFFAKPHAVAKSPKPSTDNTHAFEMGGLMPMINELNGAQY